MMWEYIVGRMGCPDENTFVALMERRLLPAQQAEVEAHVSLCTACRRLLALLSRTYVIDEAGPATTAMPSEPVAAETSHSPDAPLALGTRIGRYVVFAPLGRGAMGTLYTGYDPDLERKVAIKLIRVDCSGDLDAWSRFDEGKALARLSRDRAHFPAGRPGSCSRPRRRPDPRRFQARECPVRS